MLKGHVEIDLHNHNSGFTERIEQDNLVTDAVSQLTDFIVGRNLPINNVMPLHTVALGGIMLFEDPLIESVNNVILPDDNFIVGFAGQSLNTSDKDSGSLNIAESGPVQNGYMTVWDFSTSQANGWISSMARTHYKVEVRNPVLAESIGNANENNANSYNWPINFVDNKVLHPYAQTTTSAGNLVSVEYPIRNYSITHVPNQQNYGVIEHENVLTNSRRDWINGGDGCYYSLYSLMDAYIPSPEGGQTWDHYQVDIIRYNASNLQNLGNISICFYDSSDKNKISKDYSFYLNPSFTISNGYIYILKNEGSSFSIYIRNISQDFHENKVSIRSSTEVDLELNFDNFADWTIYNRSSISYRCIAGTNGTLIILFYLREISTYNNTCTRYIVVKSNGEYKIYDRYNPEHRTSHFPAIYCNNGIVSFYVDMNNGNSRVVGVLASYLGTICNIDVPFEKTNTTSMKVKYTLTNV